MEREKELPPGPRRLHLCPTRRARGAREGGWPVPVRASLPHALDSEGSEEEPHPPAAEKKRGGHRREEEGWPPRGRRGVRGGAASAHRGEEEGSEEEPHPVASRPPAPPRCRPNRRFTSAPVAPAEAVDSRLRPPRQPWRVAPHRSCRTTWSAASLRRLLAGTAARGALPCSPRGWPAPPTLLPCQADGEEWLAPAKLL
jgi:hypothetical protein